jgi:hypothetical protein
MNVDGLVIIFSAWEETISDATRETRFVPVFQLQQQLLLAERMDLMTCQLLNITYQELLYYGGSVRWIHL